MNLENIQEQRNLAESLKKEGIPVIDGTMGILYDENGRLFQYTSIKRILHSLKEEDIFPYVPEEKERILGELVKEYYHLKDSSITFTSGATAGLFMILSFLKKENALFLVSPSSWKNYFNILNELECDYLEIQEEDILSFISKGNDILNRKIVWILNDPLSNPSGNVQEISYLDKIVNSILSQGISFEFILDLAYIDFYKDSMERIQKYLMMFHKIPYYFIFSFSKSFCLYGLRLGFLCTNSNHITKEQYKLYKRTRYSSVSHMAVSCMIRFFQSSGYISSYQIQLQEAKLLLKRKNQRLKNILQGISIKYKENRDGFYLVLLESNPDFIIQELQKRYVYFTKVKEGIRVAVCALSMQDIQRLEKILKEVYQNDYIRKGISNSN